jgi:3',5'-cyclic AMP phosphodiesterase CpdA
MSASKPVVIAQVSDLHCGSIHYRPQVARQVVQEVNALAPDVVAITGDLTDMGYRDDYATAREVVDSLSCPRKVIIPGNHDVRNVGEVHFESSFGPRVAEIALDGVRILGVDSSQPDLDGGKVGREGYRFIEDRFGDPEEFKILAMHHHLVSVPGTGRERNVVDDAGDLLRVLSANGTDLVLCGHKHVPNVWRLEDMFIVNAGTACSLKLRGRGEPCYNVLEVFPDRVRVTLCYPFGTKEVVADFRKAHRHVCRWRPTQDPGGEPTG